MTALSLAFLSVLFFFGRPAGVWGQTLTTVCGEQASSCGGSQEIRFRGFQWKLVRDVIHGGMLWLGGTSANAGIYSNALWRYSIVDRSWTKLLDNGATQSAHCAQSGPPYDVAEPLNGHPLGYTFLHGVTWHVTAQLCRGFNAGYTNRWNLETRSLMDRLNVGLFGCSSTFDCSAANQWGSIVYVSQQNASYYCCSGRGGVRRYEEFDGSRYVDITSRVKGEDELPCDRSAHCPPARLNGASVMSDGANLWVYGGCEGSLPGNGTGANRCNGKPHNDLYRLDLTSWKWKKLDPAGSKPNPLTSSFAFIAFDSRRGRFLIYEDTDSWRQYSVAANTWSELEVSGHGPRMDASRLDNSNGNMAEYDPATDTMVLLTGRSQIYAPEVYELSLEDESPGVASRKAGGRAARSTTDDGLLIQTGKRRLAQVRLHTPKP
ncbi:MAG: hypothetical protein NZV14_00820 [Bryobacteraceae bacterium]|nr:hypothetical protein [Bryobacteraceae bacterium]MDW8376672.1 kelch repeat-containing protein [Bryobacterales bacterium]